MNKSGACVILTHPLAQTEHTHPQTRTTTMESVGLAVGPAEGAVALISKDVTAASRMASSPKSATRDKLLTLPSSPKPVTHDKVVDATTHRAGILTKFSDCRRSLIDACSNHLRRAIECCSTPSPTRILMLGLDAAGKTTILYKLRLGPVVTTVIRLPCKQMLSLRLLIVRPCLPVSCTISDSDHRL
jgi:hypothetical protein